MNSSPHKTKQIALICMMSALGNILSALSLFLANVGPIGLDLSHLATLIAAIYGGPLTGFATGALGGVFAGIYFGFIGGNLGLLSLIGIPIGKALTGLTAGWLSNAFSVLRSDRSFLRVVPTVLLSYIPESLYTAIFFMTLVPLFFGWFSLPFLISVEVKAWGELVILSVICYVLRRNKSFSGYLTRNLRKQMK
ncbi:hypothetical protein A3K70_03950 [Candidatus Bathyarchaeota archaeon RBG_16_48_13]|nr:MAG: hypothetical protein A3K70_03950 [Candidatus Bathyarchaeota archaeon RBG_16_48_13]